MYMSVFVCEVCPCHGVSVEVRGQCCMLGLTFSFYTGSGDLNLGAQPERHMLLPTELFLGVPNMLLNGLS